MKGEYRFLSHPYIIPFRIYVLKFNEILMADIDTDNYHWHKEMEINFILEGTVKYQVEEEYFILREKDVLLINSNEIHSFIPGKDSLMITFQIDLSFFDKYNLNLNNIKFKCNTALYKKCNQEDIDILRLYLSKMIWELENQPKSFQLQIESIIYALIALLYREFDYIVIDNEKLIFNFIDYGKGFSSPEPRHDLFPSAGLKLLDKLFDQPPNLSL